MLLNKSVLVLNSSFQPLHVCHVKRAIVLVLGGKAEVLEYYENRFIRSVSSNYQMPCVVRLTVYINPGRRKVSLGRRNILRRDGFRCQYCGTTREPLTTDHIIPRSKGGPDSWENLVTACVKCNNKKANRTPDQAGMKMLSKPKSPSYFAYFQYHYTKNTVKWKRYLFME